MMSFSSAYHRNRVIIKDVWHAKAAIAYHSTNLWYCRGHHLHLSRRHKAGILVGFMMGSSASGLYPGGKT